MLILKCGHDSRWLYYDREADTVPHCAICRIKRLTEAVEKTRETIERLLKLFDERTVV